ncbi:MAG: DJ-1/PfpI family protein [Desulfobacterales bacterium]
MDFLAISENTGFADIELVNETGFHPAIRSRFGLKVEPDILFSAVNPKNYRALVLPGGFYSYGFDEAFDEKTYRLANDIYYKGGFIATMCVGILPMLMPDS